MSDDNRPLKYMRYAIGEIVLVVIGILIALSINNWNEKRKETDQFNTQLVKVQEELKDNIYFFNHVIEVFQDLDSLSSIARNGLVTPEMINQNNEYAKIIISADMLYIQDVEFKNLTELNIALSKSQDSVLDLLKGIYIIHKKFLDELYKEQYDLVNSNYRDLSESKDWFSKWINTDRLPEQAFYYFLNDPFYFNKLSLHNSLIFKTTLPYTLNIRDLSIKAHRLISKYFNSKNEFLNYPIEEYIHFKGFYQGEKSSMKIEDKEDKLFLIWKEKDGELTPQEIFPISKTCFTAMDNNGYYYLRLDTINNVEKIVDSNNMTWDEYIKIE